MTKPITDDILSELDQRAEVSFSGFGISVADYKAIRERLRLAEDVVEAAYLYNICAQTNGLERVDAYQKLIEMYDAYRQACGTSGALGRGT